MTRRSRAGGPRSAGSNQMHRCLRHRQRRPALRPRHLFVVTPVRWTDRYGWRRHDRHRAVVAAAELLPRARPAHGHPRHPADVRQRLRPACSTPTSGTTSPSTSAGRTARGGHPRAPGDVPAQRSAARRRRPPDVLRDHGRRPARRVRLPATASRGVPAVWLAGLRCSGCARAGSCGSLPPRHRAVPSRGSCRRCRSYPRPELLALDATSAPSPAGCPVARRRRTVSVNALERPHELH